MPDHATPLAPPRIALLFGDAEAAAPLREAVAGHADIVYAVAALDFDAAQMTGAGAETALVNLDDGAWLDGLDRIETQLRQAGVAVVFNDPDISNGLEGWERARWQRHLLAKLTGSHDVDPPRPQVPETVVAPPASKLDSQPGSPASLPDDAAVERPLSPAEIASMTADFVEQDAAPATHAEDTAVLPVVVEVSNEAAVPADAAESKSALVALVEPESAAAQPMATGVHDDVTATTASTVAEPDHADAQDVDTEALSAMIDARLAEQDASPDVWHVAAEGEPASFGESPVLAGAPFAQASPASEVSSQPHHVSAQDDADVLASLPSLDDWQLLDPDLPTAAPTRATRRPAEPASLPDNFAGLELVPMEAILAIKPSTDPIERWLDDSQPANPAATPADAAHSAKRDEKP